MGWGIIHFWGGISTCPLCCWCCGTFSVCNTWDDSQSCATVGGDGKRGDQEPRECCSKGRVRTGQLQQQEDSNHSPCWRQRKGMASLCAENQHTQRGWDRKSLFFLSMTVTVTTRSAQMSPVMGHIPISTACLWNFPGNPSPSCCRVAPFSTFRARAALVPQPSFLLWLIIN